MNEKIQPYFLVIGLGASGVSMAKFLRTRGKRVVATDINGSRTDIAAELNALGIETEIGFHSQETFNRAHTLVPSPGIALTHAHIKTAVTHGVPITGELDIFSRYNTLPVIAITGTNGKTTTTTLIGDMLQSCGMNPFVGGNIGTPLVDLFMNQGTHDIIVAEISSFQLDLSTSFKPDVGVLLNISEDHLDRYDNYTAYENSKWRIFKYQQTSDAAVINQSINCFKSKSQQLKSRIFSFSSDRNTPKDCSAGIGPEEIRINIPGLDHTLSTARLNAFQGLHNRENIAAAVLACLAAGADINGILNGLKNFKPLSHRMAFVKTVNGISFYNDSKATNIDAVIRAIACFNRNIVLILGGREKGTDFSLLVNDVQKGVKTIIAMGESKKHIKDTFETICPVIVVQTMKDAVKAAFEAAEKDDIVLLSPACASFDMYESYVHRGNDFITHIQALENR